MNDEIWEVLYKERIPERVISEVKQRNMLKLYAPNLHLEKESRTWNDQKEAYFFVAYSWNGFCRHSIAPNNCVFTNLLYGISSRGIIELFIQCNRPYCAFNIHYCSQHCSHLVPNRYYSQLANSLDGDDSENIITAMIKSLYICHFPPFKHLSLSPVHFKKDLVTTSKLLPKLLETVEYLDFNYCFYNNTEFHSPSEILDMMFNDSNCLKGLNIRRCNCHTKMTFGINQPEVDRNDDSIFYALLPYLKTTLCHLKELTLSNIRTRQYLGEEINVILENLQELELLCLNLPYLKFDDCNKFHLAQLFHRPMFKNLSVKVEIANYLVDIPSKMLITLLREFFASPYPIGLSLNVFCRYFQVNTFEMPLPFNYNQPSKCLAFKSCSFPADFSFVLPLRLIFKSLILNQLEYDTNVLHSFSKLESIVVDSITVHVNLFDIMHLCSLIGIVTVTQEWNIFISDPVTHSFIAKDLCKALLKITPGFLKSFGAVITTSVCVFETVFELLTPTQRPYFELYIIIDYPLDEHIAKNLYLTWEKCGAIALKNIVVLIGNNCNFKSEPSVVLHSLFDFKMYFDEELKEYFD